MHRSNGVSDGFFERRGGDVEAGGGDAAADGGVVGAEGVEEDVGRGEGGGVRGV